MKILILAILIAWILFLPLISGFMAKKSGRGFWSWYCISLQLPLFAILVLSLIPAKSVARKRKSKPVENDEIFNHLFISNRKVEHWLREAAH